MPAQGRSETRLGLADDGAGHDLNQRVLDHLTTGGSPLSVRDYGPSAPDDGEAEDAAACVAEAVSRGELERGVLVGTDAIGLSILANKFPGVRAAFVQSPPEAEIARRHYDANVLCLGPATRDAERVVSLWLRTPSEGCRDGRLSRHARRTAKIAALEEALSRRPSRLLE